jgi:hypothetical protein
MSVSSVSTSVPPQPPVAPQQASPPQPAAKNDGDSDDGSSVQTQKAPLPPGQGTRVDQLA